MITKVFINDFPFFGLSVVIYTLVKIKIKIVTFRILKNKLKTGLLILPLGIRILTPLVVSNLYHPYMIKDSYSGSIVVAPFFDKITLPSSSESNSPMI